MIQCPETHLFCKECILSYASTLLGSHDPNIRCMHESGCIAAIPASELMRFLPAPMMTLWERLKQKQDLEAAGLEGWEECPFCEWGCVMEMSVLEERLFRCRDQNVCGAVSCRRCKRMVSFRSSFFLVTSDVRAQDHLPKTCKGTTSPVILC